MSELVLNLQSPAAGNLPLPVPWRDPHTVSKPMLREHIAQLERACDQKPDSPELWTCLGMAYAMDHRVYPSMQALEKAREVAPRHFWAQFKYAELQYRLRALPVAEQETLKAIELASSSPEYSISRRQLQEIRRLMREGTQKPAWSKPLLIPAVVAAAICLILCLGVILR